MSEGNGKTFRVALLRGALLFPRWHASSVSAIPDLGLAYLAGMLESLGHSCVILDAPGEAADEIKPFFNTRWMRQGLSPEELVQKISDDVSLIGLSLMHSHRWPLDREIIRLVHERFPQIPLIVGGEHASACYKEILDEFPFLFSVIRGEGEETLKELCQTEFSKPKRSLVSGIAFYDEEQDSLVLTPGRERITHLDSLPFPSWKGVPLEKYFERKSGINSFGQKALPIMASRGCRHACYFCTAPQMWKKEWIRRSPSSIVQEMTENYHKYGVRHFDFVDLNLGCEREFIEELARKMIESPIAFTWALPIGTRAEVLDDDLICLLGKSGLQRVLFSPESNSQEIQSRINKNYNLKQFLKVARGCVRNGIFVKVAFVIGFPDQKTSDLWLNVKLAFYLAWLGVHDVVSLIFIPYPGTILFQQLKIRYDYCDPDKNLHLNSDFKTAQSWSQYLSDQELKKFVWFTMGGFYLAQFTLRPWRLFLGLLRIIQGRPTTNFESLLTNSFKIFRSTKKGT